MAADIAFEHFVGAPTATGCTEWTGNIGSNGYGRLKRDGKQILAHRLSYEISNGPIPADLVIRHKCDNPPCVNPDHLEIGTFKDNTRDALERNRVPLGQDQGRAKLTNAQAREILSLQGAVSQRELASRFGVSPGAIAHIHAGRNWAWLTRPLQVRPDLRQSE